MTLVLLESPIRVDDCLASDTGDRFDLVLTNPPFGKKSSGNYVTDTGELKRVSQGIVRMTSGPRPPTSSSTSCSTSRRFSR